MTVNVEFLDREPIENVITALNYEVDKTIFFGYRNVVDEWKKATESFLKKHCGVKQIEFHVLPDDDLDKVVFGMRNVIEDEMKNSRRKPRIFFDVTGGESLIMVGFGILAAELGLPIHMFDLPEGKLIEFSSDENIKISKVAKERKISLDLDMYIEMWGGEINKRLAKGAKNISAEYSENMGSLLRQVGFDWNFFCGVMSNFIPKESLIVSLNAKKLIQDLKQTPELTPGRFNEILDACEEAGFLKNVKHTDGRVAFTFVDDDIRRCICDPGSALEIYTRHCLETKGSDCRIGVHLDWDGVLHDRPGEDVLNEIDVLKLEGYVPTFVSCKNGKFNKSALYELDAVAKKFGGKYAKKIIVAPQMKSKPDFMRAQEMGIEVWDG